MVKNTKQEEILEALKKITILNSELLPSEIMQMFGIYEKVLIRIKNRSDKYKCPYCNEFLIKKWEVIRDDGSKLVNYKCATHTYSCDRDD